MEHTTLTNRHKRHLLEDMIQDIPAAEWVDIHLAESADIPVMDSCQVLNLGDSRQLQCWVGKPQC